MITLASFRRHVLEPLDMIIVEYFEDQVLFLPVYIVLKNMCRAKSTEANEIIYHECNLITAISDDIFKIKNFIMNHGM